jgi:integrase
MPRVQEPFTIHPRGDRNGWDVTLRESAGLSAATCAAWHRRALSTAPLEFLVSVTWPKTQKSANRVAQALIEYLRATGAAAPRTGANVEKWVRLFLGEKTNPRAEKLLSEGKEYSPDTLVEYASKINGHILPDTILMAKTMEATTTADLRAFSARLARKLGGPCRTQQAVWTILRMIWKSYREAHPGFVDPFLGLKKPKYTQKKRGTLTEAELVSLFTKPDVFVSELERVVLSLAFLSGLRRGEIFGLEPGDLDFKRKEIDVEHALKNFNRSDRSTGRPKWDKTRTAPLADITIKAIKALEKKQGRFERVAVYPDGSTPSEAWWRNHVAACLKRAGVKTDGRNIVPHSARHSIASALYAKGTQLETIQEMLGHSDLETTDLYIHTPGGAIDAMMATIDEIAAKKKSRKKAAGT